MCSVFEEEEEEIELREEERLRDAAQRKYEYMGLASVLTFPVLCFVVWADKAWMDERLEKTTWFFQTLYVFYELGEACWIGYLVLHMWHSLKTIVTGEREWEMLRFSTKVAFAFFVIGCVARSIETAEKPLPSVVRAYSMVTHATCDTVFFCIKKAQDTGRL